MKTLKQFMSDLGGYMPKAEGEQDFVKKHIVDKKEDMNGNGADVFQATNVKTSERPNERHGYTDEDDDKAYHGKAAPAEREAKVVNWKAIMRKYNSGMRESIELEEKKRG